MKGGTQYFRFIRASNNKYTSVEIEQFFREINETNIDTLEDKTNKTLLIVASEKGDINIIKVLLTKNPNVLLRDSDNKHALFYAESRDDITTEITKYIDKKDSFPELEAASKRKVKFANKEAFYNNLNVPSENGITLLMSAIINNNTKLANTLITNGVNINEVDKQKTTALMYASLYGIKQVTQLLLDKDAKVDVVDKQGKTALIHAILPVPTTNGNEEAKKEIVKLLLMKNADVNIVDKTKFTALSYASSSVYDKQDVVRLLLNKDAKVDIVDKYGKTALMWASHSRQNNRGTIDLLLKKNADVSIRDKSGKTALTWASNSSKKINYNGNYSQLIKICAEKGVVENIENDRVNLITAVKKVVGPILNKGDTLKARKNFATIINKYLREVEPCIEEIKGKKLALVNKEHVPIIMFNKQIGSESKYGVAYMNMGRGYAKLFKFSCKVMSATVEGNKEEIKLLDKMTNMVIKETCPNMPITYRTLTCTLPCTVPKCPSITKQDGGYFVVINELADYDVTNWLKSGSYTSETYQSVFVQMFFAVYAFHNLGYVHNDCHLGNFLVHKITPGGCWRYKIGNTTIYVPNNGYQVVLWDPGIAEKYVGDTFKDDYYAFIYLLIGENYSIHSTIKIPELLCQNLDKMYKVFDTRNTNEEEALENVFLNMEFKSIIVNGTPPDFLFNVKPYTCR